ncbi:DUF2188 domain-containing protein [Jatrophihabitans sp.]|uniref:DUF2188 domain-containing protein n=1 Tax=Jatrophihabitans sp. TaxID=1932789 RepID=UPI002F1D16D3
MEVTASYTARVERGEQFWLVTVPEIGRTTQARTLREVEPMARDLIAVMEQVKPDSFHLVTDVVFPASARAHWERAAHLRAAAAATQAEAAVEARVAARELAEMGLTVRDIGAVIGVSFQRAQQMLADSPGPRRSSVHPTQEPAVAAARELLRGSSGDLLEKHQEGKSTAAGR